MLELVIDSFAGGGGGNSVCPPMAEALVRANYVPASHTVDAAPEFGLEAVA